jgi:hypothetical protein
VVGTWYADCQRVALGNEKLGVWMGEGTLIRQCQLQHCHGLIVQGRVHNTDTYY